MDALLILIPITLVLAAGAVGIFSWAVTHTQVENLDTPRILPLLDDAPTIATGTIPGRIESGGPDEPVSTPAWRALTQVNHSAVSHS